MVEITSALRMFAQYSLWQVKQLSAWPANATFVAENVSLQPTGDQSSGTTGAIRTYALAQEPVAGVSILFKSLLLNVHANNYIPMTVFVQRLRMT